MITTSETSEEQLSTIEKQIR